MNNNVYSVSTLKRIYWVEHGPVSLWSWPSTTKLWVAANLTCVLQQNCLFNLPKSFGEFNFLLFPSFFFFFFHSSRDVFKPIFGLPKKSAYYSRFRLFKHVETLKKKVETPLRTLRVRLNVLTLFVLPILWLFKQIIDIPLFSTCPNLVQLCLS